jgi:uncharacterized RDD family membrane protein YckC
VDWYYAVGGERFGPVDQEAFDQLVSQGRITGITLVWRDGLDDWVQHQFLSGPSTAQPGEIPPVMSQCSQCRRLAASDDMVQYQDHWVCSECKDTFYQRVREGGFSPQELAAPGRRRFAGFWIRFGAMFIDGLILLAVNTVLALLLQSAVTPGRSPEAQLGPQLFINFLQLVIGITYVTFFLGKFGATPGKMACGLKVIVSNGQPISHMRAFGRYWAVTLSSIISYILLAAGIGIAVFSTVSASGSRGPSTVVAIVAIVACVVVCALSFFPFYMAGMTKQKCALHDFVCNTRVVYTR